MGATMSLDIRLSQELSTPLTKSVVVSAVEAGMVPVPAVVCCRGCVSFIVQSFSFKITCASKDVEMVLDVVVEAMDEEDIGAASDDEDYYVNEYGQVFGSEVFEHGIVDRGMTLETLRREQSIGYDAKKDWRDYNRPKEAKATIGCAVHDGWRQAKIELDHIRKKLQTRCGKEKPKFGDLFNVFFGSTSAIFHCFQTHANGIFDGHDEYLHFLLSFFLSSAYPLDPTPKN